MTSSPQFASLLCSRLCHDMINPVSAITNGLELLAEEKDAAMRQSCMELLEQSTRILADRLQFFRLAFGAAGGFGEAIPANEAKARIEALVAANKRVTLGWHVAPEVLPKPAVKILLNLAHYGLDALVRGGTLDVAAEERDGASEIVVRASGMRVVFDEAVGKALETPMPDSALDERTAPAAMVQRLASAMGGRLQVARDEDALLLGAVLPGA